MRRFIFHTCFVKKISQCDFASSERLSFCRGIFNEVAFISEGVLVFPLPRVHIFTGIKFLDLIRLLILELFIRRFF